MKRPNPIQTSKLLSMVLRHQPRMIGISLDKAGWVDTAVLLAALQRHGHQVDRAYLEEIVATSDKKRFAFNEDGSRIRASQGHSLTVDLELAPQVPPETLWHGTVDYFLDSIRATGLEKRQRHHVHLSADTATATIVGERRGKPVLLRIRAAAMHREGLRFFRSDNGVWLTDHVPPRYIAFPE
ncbi:RNA 2'-phosphotransferase [Luteolibacter sp. LG18]|uniref:RNA 2'-phosphotransferase n=1 Tax=Luteolibacter sp. LG18 TaxID=2819286 RepID=UPI002B2B1AAE|nr:putative RNA 2'-phosphotransferase [Luteolibacter sp. LG18]